MAQVAWELATDVPTFRERMHLVDPDTVQYALVVLEDVYERRRFAVGEGNDQVGAGSNKPQDVFWLSPTRQLIGGHAAKVYGATSAGWFPRQAPSTDDIGANPNYPMAWVANPWLRKMPADIGLLDKVGVPPYQDAPRPPAFDAVDLESDQRVGYLPVKALPHEKHHVVTVDGVVNRQHRGQALMDEAEMARQVFLPANRQEATALGKFQHIRSAFVDPHSPIIARCEPGHTARRSLRSIGAANRAVRPYLVTRARVSIESWHSRSFTCNRR